jgi:hypothetical protein
VHRRPTRGSRPVQPHEPDLDEEAIVIGKGDREWVLFVDDAAVPVIRAHLAEWDDPYRPLPLGDQQADGLSALP